MVTRILVVDDEPRYVRLMEANLISEGYEVLKTYDGQSSVEMVAEDQPDLVLLDVMMPGLSGFETCERIREFSSIPIIMVTAKGEEQDRVRGLDVGADDYIVIAQRSFKTTRWSSFLQPNIAFYCSSSITRVAS
jgi:DNA-binding response OmpR family regulator